MIAGDVAGFLGVDFNQKPGTVDQFKVTYRYPYTAGVRVAMGMLLRQARLAVVSIAPLERWWGDAP